MDLSGATVAELSAELVARTASPESLDRAFTLPEWMTRPETMARMEQATTMALNQMLARSMNLPQPEELAEELNNPLWSPTHS